MAKSKKKSKGKGRVSKLAKRLKGKGKKKSKKGTQSGGACETPLFFFFFSAMRSHFFNQLARLRAGKRKSKKKETNAQIDAVKAAKATRFFSFPPVLETGAQRSCFF